MTIVIITFHNKGWVQNPFPRLLHTFHFIRVIRIMVCTLRTHIASSKAFLTVVVFSATDHLYTSPARTERNVAAAGWG
jgi:hypothetical protein